jgi:hypothetical protein
VAVSVNAAVRDDLVLMDVTAPSAPASKLMLIHRECSARPLAQVLTSGHSNESIVTNIIVGSDQVYDPWCAS